MLYIFLTLVNVCAAFPLKCPEPAQWSLRARSHCPDPSKYFCLKNDLINGYSENCTIFDFLQPGRKHVLRGGLDADKCSSDRYQPWPINFYTNASTNCIFLKSLCNEEGQVDHDKGNRNIDTTCRCDYTRGYDFLVKPRNPCFCVPSKEDCSCYIKTCPQSTDWLSQDYECIKNMKNLTVSACKPIIYFTRVNIPKNVNAMEFISRPESSSNKVHNKMKVTALCIGLILFFCMGMVVDELLERYHRKVEFIYQPFSVIELLEGQTATFKYKLSTNRFAVSFLKDNNFLAQTTSITRSVVGRSKILQITNVAPSDAGTYCLKVDDRKSFMTELIIHPMFTSKIDPQICIEGNTLQLTCTVYADSIKVKWYKEEQQLYESPQMLIHSSSNRRILTIKNISLMDSGKYYAIARNVKMEIPVIVKDMFRLPLVDVTIMEGLDTKLECETEEEDMPVKWFYNGKEIIGSSGRRQIHSYEGRFHSLTIIPTSLEDTGTYSINIKGCDSIVELNVKEMPETIKRMSAEDRAAFLKAAKSGTTKRYNIRIMIVGEQNVGKTCLLRRMMKEEIDDVQSTDGINVERRKCQYELETEKWHFHTSDQAQHDQSEQFADCGFWDFAGQKEFYATHQTFLSANAVYLLVVDISKDFKTKTYNDMIEKEFDNIGEYIDFWLDNIHCFCTDDKNISMQCNKYGHLNPPVIIVGTGIDKIPTDARKERIKQFIDYLSYNMSDQNKRKHLRNPHFLSNTRPSDNRQEFELLRNDIICIAKTLPNWEEILPIRWLVLEKEIYRNRAKKAILYAEAVELATKCSFPEDKNATSELDSFLKYQHEIGNTIFFKDIEEYIVLDTEWLVDVFRCFVSDKYKPETLSMTEWAVLEETGKLEDNLIEVLLQKVPSLVLTKHKKYLLEIMEAFGILVKPLNDDAKNDFYMPCMIKALPFEDICTTFGLKTEYSSWFCLRFNFLPPSCFNHILVSFVKTNKLFCGKNDKKMSIYRNIGIFQLNETGSKKLVICLSKNLIAMQVREFSFSELCCNSALKNRLIDLVDSIKLRYRINVTYEKIFKCSDGRFYENEGIGYDEAMDKSEYLCSEHNVMHSSKEIYRNWMKEEEVEEERKNKGRRKCNCCENMSVYTCYDCKEVLCKDCFVKHNNADEFQIHSMQLSSDTFILNIKYCLGNHISSVNGVICLPNKLLVVAADDEYSTEVRTFNIKGKQQKNVIKLKAFANKLAVVDNNTVTLSLMSEYLHIAIVDLQQRHVQYIRNNKIRMDIWSPFIYIKNELYFSEKLDITVIDMSGNVNRRIELSFTPYDMCYDSYSERIYCIDSDSSDSSKIICIDKYGKTLFPFTDPHLNNAKSLNIDNDGNVLVLCTKTENWVIKVDSDGKSCEVVITNTRKLRSKEDPCICFHHFTNSVVVGVNNLVYIFQGKAKE